MSDYDWKSIPMPPGIAARPKNKHGYPVPFVNHVYANGEPDLRILDARRVNQCVEARLCAICGERIGPVAVFIGGPACVENQLFSDPAMHEDCARYTAKVCPFLALQNAHHSGIESPRQNDPGVICIANPLAPPAGEKRPDKMALYFTTGWRWVLKRGGTKLIQAYKPSKLEWF